MKLLAPCLTIAVLFGVACGLGNPMVGTWKLESAAASTPKNGFSLNITPPEMSLQFKADGTFVLRNPKGEKETLGRYELKGDTLSLTLGGEGKESGGPSITYTTTLSEDRRAFDFPLVPGWKMVKE